jgi:hypothetical protein
MVKLSHPQIVQQLDLYRSDVRLYEELSKMGSELLHKYATLLRKHNIITEVPNVENLKEIRYSVFGQSMLTLLQTRTPFEIGELNTYIIVDEETDDGPRIATITFDRLGNTLNRSDDHVYEDHFVECYMKLKTDISIFKL